MADTDSRSTAAEPPAVSVPPDRRIAAFEDRYGAGSHARLLTLLRQPCSTFADIAVVFGVTRERVRQWQILWMPDALRGRDRRWQCSRLRHRRRLLEDPLFRSFYRHVRPHISTGRLSLVPAREGFRRRLVRVNGRPVFIKAARRTSGRTTQSLAAYALTAYRGTAEFVYFRLTDTDYLLLAASDLPRGGTTFVDTPDSKYQRFRNTIAVLALEPATSLVPPAQMVEAPLKRLSRS